MSSFPNSGIDEMEWETENVLYTLYIRSIRLGIKNKIS